MSHRSQSVSFQTTKSSSETKKRQLSAILSPSILKQNTNSTYDRISPTKSSIEPLHCSFEELLARFALASSEIERLLLLNKLTRKEVELWKRKYKECDRLLERKTAIEIEMEENNSVYKQKYEKLKENFLQMSNDLKNLEVVLQEKEEELSRSKGALTESGIYERNKDSELWRAKYFQLESDYISQLQELRDQTEIVMRTQIEREVNVAFRYYEKERNELQENCRALNVKINQLQEEIGFSKEEKDQALRQLGQLKGHLVPLENARRELEGENAWLANECSRLQSFVEERNKRIDQVEDVLRIKVKEIFELQEIYSKDMLEVNNELDFYKAKIGSHKFDSRESTKKNSNISTNLELDDSPKVLMNRNKENQQIEVVSNSNDTTVEMKEMHREQMTKFELEVKCLKEENKRLLEDFEEQRKTQEEELNNLVSLNNRHEEEKLVLIDEVERLKELANQQQGFEQSVKFLERERDEVKERLNSYENKIQEHILELERKNKEIEADYIRKEDIQQYEVRVKELADENNFLKKESQDSMLKIQFQAVQLQEKDKIEKVLKTEIDIVTKRLEELTRAKENAESMLPNIHESELKIESLEREVRYWKETFEQEQQHHNQQKFENEGLTKCYEELLKKLIGEIEINQKEGDLVDVIIREIRESKTALQMLSKEVLYWKTHANEIRETLLQEKLDLEGKLKQVNKSMERINGVMQEEDLETLVKKIIEIQVQTKILNEEIAFWKTKYEEKEKETQEAMQWIENEIRAEWTKKLEIELESHHNEMTARETEIMNLRVEHENDIRTIRLGYKEVEENCLALLEKNKSLEERVHVLQKEKELNEENDDKSRTSAKNLSIRLQEAEDRIMQQIGDIVTLNEKIAKKDKELENWEMKFKALEKTSDQVIQNKIENLEIQMKQELQAEKKKYYEESQVIKRELEEKSLAMKRKTEEIKQLDIERKVLVIENNKLNRNIEELTNDLKLVKVEVINLEKGYESKLNNAKNEMEKETQSQLGLKLKAVEAEFRGKVSFHEEQTKELKDKINDFSLREVLYFIEMERLHSVGAELVEDINTLNEELKKVNFENNNQKQQIEELIKEQLIYQKEKASQAKLEEIILDLKQQVEEYETRSQKLPNVEIKKSIFSNFKSLEIDAFKCPLPSGRSSVIEKRLAVSRCESMKQSQADVTDLTNKFESDKNSMDNQLNQLKKIIETNKREIQAKPETNNENKPNNNTALNEKRTLKIFS